MGIMPQMTQMMAECSQMVQMRQSMHGEPEGAKTKNS